MGFEAACDLLWFLKRRSVVERKEKKQKKNLLFVFLGCLLSGVSLEIV